MSVLKNEGLARAESGDFVEDCVEVILSYVGTALISYIVIGLTSGNWNQIALAAFYGLALFIPAWLTMRFTGVFDWLRSIF